MSGLLLNLRAESCLAPDGYRDNHFVYLRGSGGFLVRMLKSDAQRLIALEQAYADAIAELSEKDAAR